MSPVNINRINTVTSFGFLVPYIGIKDIDSIIINHLDHNTIETIFSQHTQEFHQILFRLFCQNEWILCFSGWNLTIQPTQTVSTKVYQLAAILKRWERHVFELTPFDYEIRVPRLSAEPNQLAPLDLRGRAQRIIEHLIDKNSKHSCEEVSESPAEDPKDTYEEYEFRFRNLWLTRMPNRNEAVFKQECKPKLIALYNARVNARIAQRAWPTLITDAISIPEVNLLRVTNIKESLSPPPRWKRLNPQPPVVDNCVIS